MKRLLLLLLPALCIAAEPITPVSYPTVTMTEEFTTNVALGPGAVMKRTLAKGSVLPLVREKSESLVVTSGSIQIEVPIEKTDLDSQKKAHREKVAADRAKQEAHDKEAKAAWEAAHKNEGYQSALKIIDRVEATKDVIVGTDVQDYLQLIASAKKVIAAHESKDSEAEAKANQDLNKVFESLIAKDAVAAKYNEFLKSYTATPVTYDLYNKEDRFYLCVGDGKISTVSTIDPQNLQPIGEWLLKSRKWAGECYDQKINATKDSPSWGGISFTLHSEEAGRRCTITLHARGNVGHQSLIEEQDVILTLLNVSRLIDKISHSDQLYKDREAAKSNGDRLQ